MDDKEKWRERTRDIRTSSTTWWWWWWWWWLWYTLESCIYIKKREKQNNQKRWIYCNVEPMLNVSVWISFMKTLISWKLFTQGLILVKITGANKMYTSKRYKRAYSVLNLKILSTCLACEMIFENVGFFKGQEKSSSLLKKYAEIGKFSYILIVLKSSMLDVV